MYIFCNKNLKVGWIQSAENARKNCSTTWRFEVELSRSTRSDNFGGVRRGSRSLGRRRLRIRLRDSATATVARTLKFPSALSRRHGMRILTVNNREHGLNCLHWNTKIFFRQTLNRLLKWRVTNCLYENMLWESGFVEDADTVRFHLFLSIFFVIFL